ncbi:MAG: hypothetical protein KDA72_18190 [Planctomycetales bacterium]|nr:hypothetical protein [Planctomycetales bacterium]
MSPRAFDADSNAVDVAEPAGPDRPIIARRVALRLLMLFCVGGLSAGVARNYLFSQPTGVVSEQDGIVVSIPKPSLTPEDVVREQVESMRASTTNPNALVTCFSFASPSNRELTGPYERFAKLVNTEPYRQIKVCREYQIGRAMIEGDAASVLVPILIENGPGAAFQFQLTKQSEAPYRDCWMTDGVFPLLPLHSGLPRSEPPIGKPSMNGNGLPFDAAQPPDDRVDEL